MPGTRVAIDGLWRCLCPSIDEVSLLRALNNPAPFLSRRSHVSGRRLSNCSAAWRTRDFHTSGRRCNITAADTQDGAPRREFLPRARDHRMHGDQASIQIDPTMTVEVLLAGSTRDTLARAPTKTIYDALRIMARQPKRRKLIRSFVKYLVEHRSEAPNSSLYTALLASNWEPSGSAQEVRQILDEMRTLGIGATSSLYHATLRALAIHPDYLLRNRIISEMKERWLDIDVEGRCSIALGLLRDGQHEMALDKLEQMTNEGLELPSWLFDIFIFNLAQHGHLDEAIALIHRQTQLPEPAGRPISPNIWSFLLDECSRLDHHEGTLLVWTTAVRPRLIVPSDGTCLNVLNTASRQGDTKLATDAITHLSSRNVKLGTHHYEALVDCYANRDDVPNALQALSIMAKAGAQPTPGSTRAISAAFMRRPALARAGLDALLRTAESDVVPLAAFNAVVAGLCLHGDADRAVDLYRRVRRLCGRGPDAHTFAPLVEAAIEARSNAARFLLDEMRAFGVPLRDALESLLRTCVADGDLDGAFVALDELYADWRRHRTEPVVPGSMPRPDEWIGRETVLELVKACVRKRDERVWHLLRDAKKVGVDLGAAGRGVEEAVRMGDWEGGKSEVIGELEERRGLDRERNAETERTVCLEDEGRGQAKARADVGSG